jgi:hypothetical protein
MLSTRRISENNRTGITIGIIHPDLMTTQERIEEAGGILAIGMMRACQHENDDDKGEKQRERHYSGEDRSPAKHAA